MENWLIMGNDRRLCSNVQFSTIKQISDIFYELL